MGGGGGGGGGGRGGGPAAPPKASVGVGSVWGLGAGGWGLGAGGWGLGAGGWGLGGWGLGAGGWAGVGGGGQEMMCVGVCSPLYPAHSLALAVSRYLLSLFVGCLMRHERADRCHLPAVYGLSIGPTFAGNGIA